MSTPITVTWTFSSLAELIKTLGPLAGAAVTEVPAADPGKPSAAPTAASRRTAAAAPSTSAPSPAAPAPSPKPQESAASTAQTAAATSASQSGEVASSYPEVKGLVAKLGPALVAKLGQTEGRAALLGVAEEHGGATFLALEKATEKHAGILASLRTLAATHGVEL